MTEFFSYDLVVGLFQATIRLATPLTLAAVGETYAQRSGVMNLGIEGMMVFGAFGGFVAGYFTHNLWVGVFVGMLVGLFISALMAFLSISLGADQMIAGVLITFLSWGLVAYLVRAIFGTTFVASPVRFESVQIPVLSDLEFLGPILFQQSALVYITWLVVPVTWLILTKTTFGLNLSAVGEDPKVADASGINVYAVRYACVFIGGIMAGLAGAFMSLSYISVFEENIIAGRGWIAVALTIFGTWNPLKVFAGALLFGGIDALQLRLQALGIAAPYQLMLMLRYLLTIAALMFISTKKVGLPASLGIPYQREG